MDREFTMPVTEDIAWKMASMMGANPFEHVTTDNPSGGCRYGQ
jgi:hypothetical protein